MVRYEDIDILFPKDIDYTRVYKWNGKLHKYISKMAKKIEKLTEKEITRIEIQIG